MRADAQRIARSFRDRWDGGPLKDPLTGATNQLGYGTAFLACLFLRLASTDNSMGVPSHELLSAAVEQNRANVNRLGTSSAHFEFNNFALLDFVLRTTERDAEDVQRAMEVLRRWKHEEFPLSNWVAMRALNYRLRFDLRGKGWDFARSNLELWSLLRRQTPEGFFPDQPTSFSFQYHAFTTATLLRLYESSRSSIILSAALQALDLIRRFIAPDGDFNYFGRGQRQIFGCVSLVFALAAASKITRRQEYLADLERVYSFLLRHRNELGYPLCLTGGQEPFVGWYAYNSLADYLPFAAVYLFDAATRLPDVGRIPETRPSPESAYFPRLGLFLYRSDDRFAVVSTAQLSNSQRLGPVKVWPRVVPVLGGPSKKLRHPRAPTLEPCFFARDTGETLEARLGAEGPCVRLVGEDKTLAFEYAMDFERLIFKIAFRPIRGPVKTRLVHLVALEDPEISVAPLRKSVLQSLDGEAILIESDEETLRTPTEVTMSWGKPDPDWDGSAIRCGFRRRPVRFPADSTLLGKVLSILP